LFFDDSFVSRVDGVLLCGVGSVFDRFGGRERQTVADRAAG
jgi:hypothetical protein